jgi:hypothetical protein
MIMFRAIYAFPKGLKSQTGCEIDPVLCKAASHLPGIEASAQENDESGGFSAGFIFYHLIKNLTCVSVSSKEQAIRSGRHP